MNHVLDFYENVIEIAKPRKTKNKTVNFYQCYSLLYPGRNVITNGWQSSCQFLN